MYNIFSYIDGCCGKQRDAAMLIIYLWNLVWVMHSAETIWRSKNVFAAFCECGDNPKLAHFKTLILYQLQETNIYFSENTVGQTGSGHWPLLSFWCYDLGHKSGLSVKDMF